MTVIEVSLFTHLILTLGLVLGLLSLGGLCLLWKSSSDQTKDLQGRVDFLTRRVLYPEQTEKSAQKTLIPRPPVHRS